MYRIVSLDEIGPEAWNDFVLQCPEATFFHRAEWRDVITRSFGHTCYYLGAEKDGSLVGVLPLTWVKSWLFGSALISNGFCVAGGPAVVEEGARTALDEAALDLLKKTGADYLEYRSSHHKRPGWQSKSDLYAGFSRSIEADEDSNLKQIPRKQRAVVRKALTSDELSVTHGSDVDDLYHLYAISVRNLGTPVFSKKYFQQMAACFGDDCEITTISHQGKPVSSVLSFYFKDTVLPYYTGSVPEARRLGSNDLMYWRVMRRAVERGCRTFDFGRSKVDTGPYSFKKNWGFEPVPIVHEFHLAPGQPLPNLNPTNPKFSLAIEVWRRFPLFVANRLGPLIVRNIG